MPQAAGDPEELERFAHALRQFIDSLTDAVGNLNGAFASLGDTWQDEKRARFEEDYNGRQAVRGTCRDGNERPNAGCRHSTRASGTTGTRECAKPPTKLPSCAQCREGCPVFVPIART